MSPRWASRSISSAVTFPDSTGIRALVLGHQAAHRKGVTMRVTGPRGRVESVLKITGVYEMLLAPPVSP